MANLCSTQYVFIGEKNDVKEFALALDSVTNNLERNYFERFLCCHLATDILGINPFKNGIYVRGEFFVENVKDNRLELSTSTAGEPCYKLFRLLSERFNLKCYWMAEETGSKGIWSNDSENIIWEYEYMVRTENDDYYINSRKELSEFKRANKEECLEVFRVEYIG